MGFSKSMFVALAALGLQIGEMALAGENADARIGQVARDAPMGERSHSGLLQISTVQSNGRGEIQQIDPASPGRDMAEEDVLLGEASGSRRRQCVINPEDATLVERMRLSGRAFNDDCAVLSPLDAKADEETKREELIVAEGLLAAEHRRIEVEASSEREAKDRQIALEAAQSAALLGIFSYSVSTPGN
jgi:hypothetical protein